ncbi:Ty3/gypsy retrotransposon protein [Senna tora]|uniref:Ty3/gypsy retrotransposon protein n=1 Tax=Senna tora TaxID=362788 RepID=A0A834SNK0_9FABA|nr:Ty3/gypsy retrotransposon protein [Senna tora]
MANGTHNQNQNHLAAKNLKWEIPAFDGTDAEFWVFKIKQFFMAAKVPVDQRVILASSLMIGPAYTWSKWMCPNHQLPSWDEFLEALLFRFGATLYDDPRVALKKEEQVNTVAEYKTKSTKVPGSVILPTIESMVIVADDDEQEAKIIKAEEVDLKSENCGRDPFGACEILETNVSLCDDEQEDQLMVVFDSLVCPDPTELQHPVALVEAKQSIMITDDVPRNALLNDVNAKFGGSNFMVDDSDYSFELMLCGKSLGNFKPMLTITKWVLLLYSKFVEKSCYNNGFKEFDVLVYYPRINHSSCIVIKQDAHSKDHAMKKSKTLCVGGDECPNALWAKIISFDDTPLHVAALFRHVGIVEELVRLATSPSDLEILNVKWYIVLAVATNNANTRLAECME